MLLQVIWKSLRSNIDLELVFGNSETFKMLFSFIYVYVYVCYFYELMTFIWSVSLFLSVTYDCLLCLLVSLFFFNLD